MEDVYCRAWRRFAIRNASALLILALAIAVTACGGSMGSNPTSPSGQASKPPPTTQNDPTDPPPAASVPTATNGSLAATMGAATNGALSSSGSGALTYTISTPPQGGTVVLTNASTGAFTYTSYPNFEGRDSFQFTVTNSAGASQPAIETITVASSAIGAEQAVANLGVSIDWLCYWCAAQPYVNIMRQAADFYDLTTSVALAKEGLLDPSGWPEADFGVFVAANQSADGGPGDPGNGPTLTGAYQLSFIGQAKIFFGGYGTVSNINYNTATNITTATINVTAATNGSAPIILKFSNTQRTPTSAVGSGITNIQLIRPQFGPNGQKWWDNPSQEFTDPFLNSIKGFSTIRYIDWTHVIGSPEINWSDRTPPNWPTADHPMQIAPAAASYVAAPAAGCAQYCNWSSTGASWESAIEIANATHTDMWINIPVMASDDYVTQLATLLKAKLNPNLHVYVEWSDEIWNTANPFWTETNYNNDQTTALLASNPTEAANYQANCPAWNYAECHVAERVMQFSQDFAFVYGQAAINTTIRPVLCTQVTQPVLLMMALRFIALTYGPPKQYFYGTCGAPYWDAPSTVPAGTTAAGAVAAFDQAIPSNDNYLQTDAAIALFYGLHSLTYEGGPEITSLAVAGDTSGKETATLQAATQIAPGMKADVVKGLTSAFADGVDMYMYYQNVSPTYWGATTDPLDLLTPKFQGLQAVAGSLITRTAGTTLPGSVAVNPTTFGITGGALVLAGPEVTGTNCQLTLSPPVCSFNTSIAKGDGIAFLVNVPKAGNYAISINMGTTQTTFAGSVQFALDQKPVQTFSFPRTSAGVTLTLGPATVSLSAGLHLIAVLNDGNGNYAIDGITATAN